MVVVMQINFCCTRIWIQAGCDHQLVTDLTGKPTSSDWPCRMNSVRPGRRANIFVRQFLPRTGSALHSWFTSRGERMRSKINGIRKFGDEQYIPVFGITLPGRNVTPTDEMKGSCSERNPAQRNRPYPAGAIGQNSGRMIVHFRSLASLKTLIPCHWPPRSTTVYISCENKILSICSETG